jgi:internalin A
VHRPIQIAKFDDSEAIDPAAIHQMLEANKRGHVLAFDHPSVTDAFMPVVAEQADLTEINLDGASVSDVGVAALGKSQAPVKKLDLEHLDISDKSIRFIKHFPLEYLNIQQTNVTDAGLAEISEIKSLCDLEMARVLCSPKGLEALTALPNLDTIDVSMIPGFTDEWLKPIGQCKALRKLDIEANNVRGPGLAYLKDLKKLDFLRARAVKFDPDGLTHLPLLPSLTRLELPAATVTKKDIAWLARLPALKTLELHETAVDDDAIAPLAASKSLENLDLHKTDVTASGIKRLKAIPTLEKIDVKNTKIDPSEFGSLQSYMEPIKLVND